MLQWNGGPCVFYEHFNANNDPKQSKRERAEKNWYERDNRQRNLIEIDYGRIAFDINIQSFEKCFSVVHWKLEITSKNNYVTSELETTFKNWTPNTSTKLNDHHRYKLYKLILFRPFSRVHFNEIQYFNPKRVASWWKNKRFKTFIRPSWNLHSEHWSKKKLPNHIYFNFKFIMFHFSLPMMFRHPMWLLEWKMNAQKWCHIGTSASAVWFTAFGFIILASLWFPFWKSHIIYDIDFWCFYFISMNAIHDVYDINKPSTLIQYAFFPNFEKKSRWNDQWMVGSAYFFLDFSHFIFAFAGCWANRFFPLNL